eukprot:SAG11_NODE_1928_length_4053_cov_6.814112_3_plen_62_part_00
MTQTSPALSDSRRMQIVSGGTERLAVIADFDRTITRCFVGETRCASCYGELRITRTGGRPT